jgi:hypothetical protein
MNNLFIDPELVLEKVNWVHLLLPLKSSDRIDDVRFRNWCQKGRTLIIEVEGRCQAGIAVIPHDLTYYLKDPELLEKLQASIKINRDEGLVTWAFYWNDDNQSIDLPGTRVFRTGGYLSQSKPYEEGMPSFCEDLMEFLGENKRRPLQYNTHPSVAFCGNADSKKSFYTLVLKTLKPDEGDIGRSLRLTAIKNLSRSKNVKTEFHTFETFFVGQNSLTPEERLNRRKLFIENMLSSEYALVVRGTGNYSYRHYEAMSLGRVPLFIDTDCLLPLPDFIDWPKTMAILDKNNIRNISGFLHGFHNSNDDLDRWGANSRKVWSKYLTAEGFFQTILSDQKRARLDNLNWSPYKV